MSAFIQLTSISNDCQYVITKIRNLQELKSNILLTTIKYFYDLCDSISKNTARIYNGKYQTASTTNINILLQNGD